MKKKLNATYFTNFWQIRRSIRPYHIQLIADRFTAVNR